MSRYSERRSKVSPMDFEYTSEELKQPPAWDSSEQARKRSLPDMNSSVYSSAFPGTPTRSNVPLNNPGTPSSSAFSAYAQSPTKTPFRFGSPPTGVATPPPSSLWRLSGDFNTASKTGITDSMNGIGLGDKSLDIADVSMQDNSPLVQKGKQKEVTIIDPKRERDEEHEGLEEMAVMPGRKSSGDAIRRRNGSKPRSKLAMTSKNRSFIEEDDGSTDEYTDNEDPRRSGMAKQDSITSNHHYTFNMPSMPVSKSEVPYMLLGYVQFLFNLSLVLVFLYILIHCIITIQRDVEHRISQHRTELAEQIAACAQLYEINKCFPLTDRVPALARPCGEWETCMQRDPSGVARARVVAETIGEVINSFVEPISWKTLIFGLISLGFLITLINVLFSFYRARIAPEALEPHPAIRHASLPPAIFPGTPVHTRYMSPQALGYVDPVSPLRLDQPVDWGRTWSGTELPISRSRAGTPSLGTGGVSTAKGKKRA